MCPIISDLREQMREQHHTNHNGKRRGKNRATTAVKTLSKSAYRKQKRYGIAPSNTQQEAPVPASLPKKTENTSKVNKAGRRHVTKQAAPVVMVGSPSFGSYLPDLKVLCAIGIVVGIIMLIRNK